MGSFCKLTDGLQTPHLATSREKSPIVSGGYLKHSRFQETAAGDRFDLHCVAGPAVVFPYFSLDRGGKSGVLFRNLKCIPFVIDTCVRDSRLKPFSSPSNSRATGSQIIVYRRPSDGPGDDPKWIPFRKRSPLISSSYGLRHGLLDP